MNQRLKIKNCNNISCGEIIIEENKLNILFGRNGTGKSTIARAIYLSSKQLPLAELAPYGGIDKNLVPQIEVDGTGDVAIFDDNYVKQYVYQKDTLIKDAFEVLVRSNEYDDAKHKIDSALEKIKTTITNDESIVALQKQIAILIKNIEITGSTNKMTKRKVGIKSVLSGKGAYFNPPSELDSFKEFFQEESVAKWAAWRLTGYNEYGSKGLCPYCSAKSNEETQKIDTVFVDSFDKASVEYASEISQALTELSEYLDDKKVSELLSLFGVKDDVKVLEAQLTKLGAEARYLHNRLTAIISFNGSSVDRDNISELETMLKDMKIDPRACDTYFVSALMSTVIDPINNEIEELLKKVNNLKTEIGRYNKYINDKVKERKDDINEFLKLAGFKYTFDVEINGENDARAILKYILPDGTPAGVQSPDSHLSWGEKHAFALVLFMFDAIRSDAKLIILDDPISSFDSNKKYAIINRLFKTGSKGNSLYEKTVLLLTHDFEPIIDYIQTNSGRQTPTSVCATYFENVGGNLSNITINKGDDILSSVVLFKELARDTDIDIAARLGCLRKYIEHQYKNPIDDSDAYNIISSVIHGRANATHDSEGKHPLTADEFNKGLSYIKEYIQDFEYNDVLEKLSIDSLIERYKSEKLSYIKMLLLRAYTEQNTEARKRLRNKNDVLRKYIDETYHIENDYIYSLDVRKFNVVPENYISDANEFMECEEQLLKKEQ